MYGKQTKDYFNTMNLYRWFKQQGGKEKSPMEKPYLTEDQKKGGKVRMVCSRKGENGAIC